MNYIFALDKTKIFLPPLTRTMKTLMRRKLRTLPYWFFYYYFSKQEH